MSTDVHSETVRNLINQAFANGAGYSDGDLSIGDPFWAGTVELSPGQWFGLEISADDSRQYHQFSLRHEAFEWQAAEVSALRAAKRAAAETAFIRRGLVQSARESGYHAGWTHQNYVTAYGDTSDTEVPEHLTSEEATAWAEGYEAGKEDYRESDGDPDEYRSF